MFATTSQRVRALSRGVARTAPSTRQRSAVSFATSSPTRVPAGTDTARPDAKRSPTVTVSGSTRAWYANPGGGAGAVSRTAARAVSRVDGRADGCRARRSTRRDRRGAVARG